MNIVTRLLVLLPLLWVEGVWSVDCPQENYTLRTQAEVDALGAIACDHIVGRLHVTFSTHSDSSKNIINLDGLSSITSIGGAVLFKENSALESLDGLANLISVGGDLQFGQNSTAITDLEGLTSLTNVGGALTLGPNARLRSVDGLVGLTSVGGLVIGAGIPNIDGLGNLTSIEGSLTIQYNDDLADITALENITSVENLSIVDTHLTNLDGLRNLTRIGSSLYIYENWYLTDLDGLASLTSAGSLVIYANRAQLRNCQGVARVLGWPSGPSNVGGNTSVTGNGSGCNSTYDILNSVSGPTQPAISQVYTYSSTIKLAFMRSTTTDTAFPITGYSASCDGSSVSASDWPATVLLNDAAIQNALTVSGYGPASAMATIEVEIDITHEDPTNLRVTLTSPEGTELVLWNQGTSDGADLIGTFPTSLSAVDSLDSIATQTMNGEWVLSVGDSSGAPLSSEAALNSWGLRIAERLSGSRSGPPIEVVGATRGRDYTCTVAPMTKLGMTPVSDLYTVTVPPAEFPAVPDITSTDYGDGKIILTVSVSDNGGTDITEYEATCTDGTSTFTGTSTSSPITVSGLTNDVAYTCTVTATNSVGTSSASAATDPITPEAMATGLPIWLLYQATQ